MTKHKALGIVLDLASQNALSEEDADLNDLREQYNLQREALEIIEELLGNLGME